MAYAHGTSGPKRQRMGTLADVAKMVKSATPAELASFREALGIGDLEQAIESAVAEAVAVAVSEPRIDDLEADVMKIAALSAAGEPLTLDRLRDRSLDGAPEPIDPRLEKLAAYEGLSQTAIDYEVREMYRAAALKLRLEIARDES